MSTTTMVQCIVEDLDEIFAPNHPLQENPEKFLFEARQLLAHLKLYDKNHKKVKEYEHKLSQLSQFQNNNNVKSKQKIPNHEDVKTSSERLKKSLEELTETEKVADEALLELARQRTVILKSQDHVAKVKSEELSKANKSVSNMSKWWRW